MCSSMAIDTKVMIASAVDAVDQLEAWSQLASYSPPVNSGFMFDTSPLVNRVTNKICELNDNHSGSSMGWTMRQIEFIAKNGVDAYIQLAENRL